MGCTDVFKGGHGGKDALELVTARDFEDTTANIGVCT